MKLTMRQKATLVLAICGTKKDNYLIRPLEIAISFGATTAEALHITMQLEGACLGSKQNRFRPLWINWLGSQRQNRDLQGKAWQDEWAWEAKCWLNGVKALGF